MESLGEYLKRERERRGVSLDEIARVTRVRRQHLEALESDRFDRLPAAPFVRGFLAAYARQVGLSPDEVTARYQTAMAAAPSSAARVTGRPAGRFDAAPQAPATPPARALPPPPTHSRPAAHRDAGAHAAPPPAGYRGVLVLAGLVAVGALAVLGSMLARPATPPARPAPIVVLPLAPPAPPAPAAPEPPAEETPLTTVGAVGESAPGGVPPAAPPAAAAAAPVQETVARPAAPRAEAAGAGQAAAAARPARMWTLKATATQDAWMQVAIDGRAPIDVILRPGEETSWRGGRFEVVVGNAGGVSLAVDGVPQPALGEPGQVVRVTLPRPSSQ